MNFRGCLLVGYGLIVLLSIVGVVYSIIKISARRSLIKETQLVSGIIIFFLFFAIAMFLNYDRLFTQWDEIGDWGMTLKSLYNFNALGTYKEATTLIYRSYPPATTIWEYFWCRPFPTFTEYPAYIAMNIFFFSLITPFLAKFNYKRILAVIIFCLIPLLPGFQFYNSLYADYTMGVLFGSLVLFYYLYDYEKSLYGILMVIASCFMLTITKDMGFILSGIAILIFCIDILLFKRDSFKKFILERSDIKSKSFRILLLSSPIIICILTKAIWQVHLEIAGIKPLWNISSVNISAWINGNLQPYQQTTLNMYIHALIYNPISPLKISLLKFLAIFCVAGFIMSTTIKRQISSIRLKFAIIGMTIGCALYSLILLIFYMFIIWSYEALILASYERYIFTFVIGACISLLIYLLLDPPQHVKSPKSSWNEILKVLNSITIFTLLYILVNSTKSYIKSDILSARNTISASYTERTPYTAIIKWREDIIKPEEKLYIISQGSSGFDKLELVYNIYPANVNLMVMDYSVSLSPYFPELNDPWTMIITSTDWEKYVINNYTLLYIYHYDDRFASTYGEFFDTLKNDQLYKVNDIGGTLKLTAIPTP
jgi:hypothetical protein